MCWGPTYVRPVQRVKDYTKMSKTDFSSSPVGGVSLSLLSSSSPFHLLPPFFLSFSLLPDHTHPNTKIGGICLKGPKDSELSSPPSGTPP